MTTKYEIIEMEEFFKGEDSPLKKPEDLSLIEDFAERTDPFYFDQKNLKAIL